MTFKSFNLEPRVMAGVQALGYTTPTPIQLEAIPPVMRGHDVMGLAQTGTGKTAAFVLPILNRLLNGPRGHVRAMVLAPTRELAEQIHETFGALGKQTGLRSMTIYGGVGTHPQIMQLRKGVEIVVACPGRLLDHIAQGTITLSSVEVLVIDEADRMFDMGFLPDIRRVLRHLPSARQTLLFSATMPPDIRRLAQDILREPVTVQIRAGEPVGTVSHALYPVAQHLKTALLLELLYNTDAESVLVFTRTKHRAKRLGENLESAGFRVASLQGNLSQNRRQSALDGFRDGTYQILVATDIAARGIDVTQISHVINYDMPDTVDAYTHRIGRTGRAARTGDAFTLVAPEDADMVRSIERVLGTALERRTVAGFDYNKPGVARNTEFARPPREPQRRRQVTPEAPRAERFAAQSRPSFTEEARRRDNEPGRSRGHNPGRGNPRADRQGAGRTESQGANRGSQGPQRNNRSRSASGALV